MAPATSYWRVAGMTYLQVSSRRETTRCWIIGYMYGMNGGADVKIQVFLVKTRRLSTLLVPKSPTIGCTTRSTQLKRFGEQTFLLSISIEAQS